MSVAPAKYVKLDAFQAMTGYTPKAVHRKKEEGIWLYGRELVKAPDGNTLVNMEAYYAWVEKETA